jgi:CheY-like chemotaxis protein
MGFPVENATNKGSQSNQVGPTLAHAPGAEKLPLNYYSGTETILVVDDEESLRTVVVDLLGQLGYRMLSAASGQEALKLAGEYPGRIDLLLSDVIMEGLPGPELAEKLVQSRPELKVVFISGFADHSIAPNGVLKPGTVLIQKPFTVRVLSAKLREVLDSR